MEGLTDSVYRKPGGSPVFTTVCTSEEVIALNGYYGMNLSQILMQSGVSSTRGRSAASNVRYRNNKPTVTHTLKNSPHRHAPTVHNGFGFLVIPDSRAFHSTPFWDNL
jgi:hypothetical protein